MPLNHLFCDQGRVINPQNHRGDSVQLRHPHISGAAAAFTSIFTTPVRPIRPSGSIPPVSSCTVGGNVAQELGAPRKLYANTVPSRARGCSLGAYTRASSRPPQPASTGSPVGVPAHARTKSFREAVPARDGLRLSVEALKQRPQLLQCSTCPRGNGCTPVSAPFPSSVLPPWAWLDFTAFASPGFCVNEISAAGGGGNGLVSRDVNLTDNRIATPGIQAGRARNGVSSLREERQKRVLSEPHASSHPVTTTACEVSTVAVRSSFSCSPLFDWVPYDGWDDSELCQVPGGCYRLRGLSNCQCSDHGGLRHGDLSGMLGSTEFDTSTAGRTQAPGTAGKSAVGVAGAASQAAVLSQRSEEVDRGCANAPPAGQQAWRQREAPVLTASLEALTLDNALERDMECGVYCSTHEKGKRGGGNVGGPDAAGGQRGVNAPSGTPPTPASPTVVARGSASLSQLRREGVAVGPFPFSVVVSRTRAVEAEGVERSSGSASDCVSAAFATASRRVVPLPRGGSSSASRMYTDLRTVPAQSSTTVGGEGLDCIPSAPRRTLEASAVPSMYFSIIAEDAGLASVVQSSLPANREGSVSHRLLFMAGDSAATGRDGLTLPSVRPPQERAAFGDTADNRVSLNGRDTDLTLGLPAQVPSASLAPRLPGGERPLCAAAVDADRILTGAGNTMTCEYNSRQPRPRDLDYPMSAKSARTMPMSDLQEPSSASTLPGSDVDGGGNHIWSAFRAPLTERNVGNSASAPVSWATAAVADATSRGTVARGALGSECGRETVSATYAMGATRAGVPVAESTVLATHVTGTGRGEVPPISASSPVVPTFIVVKLKHWRAEDPIMPDLSTFQVAEDDGSRLDRCRSRRPTTSLLPEWCHAIANTLLAPSPVLLRSHLPDPQCPVASSGTSVTPTAGAATVPNEVVSQFGIVRTQGGRSMGSTANNATVAQLGSCGQPRAELTATATATVGSKNENWLARQRCGAASLTPFAPAASSANLGSAVDGLGHPHQTGLKGSSPVFLMKGLLGLPTSTACIDDDPESVSGSRGVVRKVSKEGIVGFDGCDAPPMYNRVLTSIDSTHAHTATTTTTTAAAAALMMASGGGAPAAAVIRRLRCARSFHCSTLSALCQDHQEQPKDPCGGDSGRTASARGLSCVAFVSSVTSLASPMGNVGDVCTLRYGDDPVADDLAWVVPCSGTCVTRGRQGGVVSTATGVVDTPGLLPHFHLRLLDSTHRRGPSNPMMCCTSEMLAADSAMRVARKNASVHSSQPRDPQTCSTSGATAVGPDFISRHSAYITDGSPNALLLRGDDVTTTRRGVGLTISSGRHVVSSTAPQTNAIAGSPVRSVAPVGAVREGGRGKGGGNHVVDILEDLVNTTHRTHHKSPDNLMSSSFHSENIPNAYPSPFPKEGAPTPLFPLTAQLQYPPPQQRQRGLSRAVMTQSVSRMPTKPPAQHPKSGRPSKHAARCDG